MHTVVHPGTDPTVVLIAGMGEPAAYWDAVVPLLAAGTAVVVYDRPGIGATPRRPEPNPPLPYSAFAAELAQLLEELDVAGSVVLVGHSFGSLIARSFAAQWPERVAGMVHLDGSTLRLAVWHTGPLAGPYTDGDGPDATTVDTVTGEAELAGTLLPRVPSVVVSRTPGRWSMPLPDPSIDLAWTDAQAALAEQLGAAHLVASGAGHSLNREAPALVAYAIDAVVSAVRDRKPVPVDADHVRAVGGRAEP